MWGVGGGRWEVKGAKAGAEDCRDIRNIRTGICNCGKEAATENVDPHGITALVKTTTSL